MARNQVRVFIKKGDVEKLNTALKGYAYDVADSKAGEKLMDSALRKAAGPWQRAFKGGTMYKKLQRRTGGFDDPMGNKKIKGRRSRIYGRRVGPKMKGKSAGWRAHFFASPARQISSKKRVNFAAIYKKQNGKVRKILRTEINQLLNTLAKQRFK